MQLTGKDQVFIDKRRRLIHWWPLALLFKLLLLAGTWLYLFMRYPALANASFVIDAVAGGTLSADVLHLSALLLPIVVSMLFFVIAVMLLFLHQTVRNERHYQAIIRKLRQGAV